MRNEYIQSISVCGISCYVMFALWIHYTFVLLKMFFKLAYKGAYKTKPDNYGKF